MLMLVKMKVLKHYSCYYFSLVKTNFTQYSVLTLSVFSQFLGKTRIVK